MPDVVLPAAAVMVLAGLNATDTGPSVAYGANFMETAQILEQRGLVEFEKIDYGIAIQLSPEGLKLAEAITLIERCWPTVSRGAALGARRRGR
ncbi:MAG: hypothetical protein KGL39_03510 [Patescibacteria group bacterium]|nr:hypothetical protein [Patescibacteria group bacterium]